MPYALNKEKPYNPKTEKNKRSWEVVQLVLRSNGGQADLASIQKALTYKYTDEKGEEKEENHPNFVRYMIRGKHLLRLGDTDTKGKLTDAEVDKAMAEEGAESKSQAKRIGTLKEAYKARTGKTVGSKKKAKTPAKTGG